MALVLCRRRSILVPFYGQPKLGGNDDLRSFARYRYYDDNYLIVNVEHRWYAFTALDVALFADAGTVAHERGRTYRFQ